MTKVPSKNPFPNPVVASDAAMTFSPFVVKKNKGAGPKGQTSKMQIKKVAFKGVKQYNPQLNKGGFMNLLKDLWSHIKEWSDWKMKDWIKAAIVAIVVIWIISWMTGGAAQCYKLSEDYQAVKAEP